MSREVKNCIYYKPNLIGTYSRFGRLLLRPFFVGFIIYITMAENKKSFLLYCDLIHTVEMLSNEKAGELFNHILKYVNDENPVSDDMEIKLAFMPIKQALKRDLVKYEGIVERNRVNGSKGGRPRTQSETQKTQWVKWKPNQTQKSR